MWPSFCNGEHLAFVRTLPSRRSFPRQAGYAAQDVRLLRKGGATKWACYRLRAKNSYSHAGARAVCWAVVHKDWLDATMWLKRRVSHPRLVRTESFGGLGYGQHFRLSAPEDVDPSLIELLAEAYAIGQQASAGRHPTDHRTRAAARAKK